MLQFGAMTQNNMVNVICPICKKERMVCDDIARRINNKKLSGKCRHCCNIGNKYNLGNKHSQETKDKISKAHKGRVFSAEVLSKFSTSHLGQKAWNKGLNFSDESRKKMSDAHKGVPLSEKHRKSLSISLSGKNNPFYGKKHSKETKDKISKTKKLQKIVPSNAFVKGETAGDKNFSWKGGITPENKKIRNSVDYTMWRKACFERDNFTCQKTGVSGGELECHHINNFADFPELRTSIENGITLSKKAHREFHKIYGVRNNTLEQLQEYLNN